MAIRIVCPSCNAIYNVDDSLRGKAVRCRKCSESIPVARVPASADDPDRIKERPRSEPRVMTKPPQRGPVEQEDIIEAVEMTPRRKEPPRYRESDEEDPRPLRQQTKTGSNLPLLLIGGGVGGLILIVLLVVGLYFAFRSGNNPESPLPERAQIPSGPVPTTIAPDAVRKVKQATVYLRVDLPNGTIAQGSGFFCLEPGIVVTNAHVLGMLQPDNPPPRNVTVVVSSGEPNELRTTGMVLGVDRSNDVAILRVQGDASRFPPPLPVDSASKLIETQKVYVFGFPLGVQLGKNITVSESAVSALRRNETGMLEQIQVNGGMHPGNSGGPVTDARGVVVGVSVSGVIGTQINFAIPGDLVKQALDGRFAQSEVGMPYRTNNQTMLPLKLTCLDPLGRVRDVKVEVWTGLPGSSRPAAWQAPQSQPGDSARQAFAANLQNGSYTIQIPLPSLEPGRVYWLQPSLVNAAGAGLWATAQSMPLEAQSVLERRPSPLQFKAPAATTERTLKMDSTETLKIYRGRELGSIIEKMEGNVLESASPDQRGIGTFLRLTLANCPYSKETLTKKLVPPPQAQNLLSQYSPTFMVDASNATKERGKRNFQILPVLYRELVEEMYETLCNTYEATTLPLPNRVVQPLETWSARVPMFVLVENKRQVQDIFLTCTYEGVRGEPGHTEAYVSLTGVVKGRGLHAGDDLGKVQGYGLLDVEKGFWTFVKLLINTEIEIEDTGIRVQVMNDNVVQRREGNALGIRPATANQPAVRRR